MEVFVSFEEMHGYVNRHYGKNVTFSKVADKEICVTYLQKILIKDIPIPVDIHIDDVKRDSLTITYKGGLALDMIISGVLSFLKSKCPELCQGITTMDNHRIKVNLADIEKAKPVVENVAIGDILVEKSGLRIILTLI